MHPLNRQMCIFRVCIIMHTDNILISGPGERMGTFSFKFKIEKVTNSSSFLFLVHSYIQRE